MLEKIALGFAILLAALVGLIALQPSTFSVERAALIAAPPDLVYRHIHDLRAMDVWSPWVKLDPKLELAYTGPASGVGAGSSWEGPEMGKGRLTITAVRPPRRIEMELEMIEPMAATNQIVFTLAPEGSATRTRWRMEGSQGFVAKAFGLVMDMDTMVGGEFAKGLASLKALAEAEASTQDAAAPPDQALSRATP